MNLKNIGLFYTLQNKTGSIVDELKDGQFKAHVKFQSNSIEEQMHKKIAEAISDATDRMYNLNQLAGEKFNQDQD